MSKLNDRVAFVTGGANGIGRELCIDIARRGGKVVIGDIELSNAKQLADELQAAGTDALAVPCDVTQRESIEAARDAAVARFGAIHLLCANAGVAMAGTVENTRESDMRWLYEVNVFGVVRSVQAILPSLHDAAGRGEFAHVLITGSENSLGVPVVGPCSIYTSTKHAVLGIADTLRRDLQATGATIGVTLICPGVVNTQIWNSTRNRPGEFGGPQQQPPVGEKFFQIANPADRVAAIALDGCEANDFLVIPHPEVAAFTRKRANELLSAMNLCEQRAAE